MLRAVRAGDVDRALQYETLIYLSFVTAVEAEQHYYRCFADWKDDLAALGRRFRDPAALAEPGSDRVAFFLHTGFLLGHNEVLLKLLEARPRHGPLAAQPSVYVLEAFDPAFVERCRAAGVEVVLVQEAMQAHGRPAGYLERLVWLRERFRADRVGVCVWVSVPTVAAFALSMRLARVQIFWALRFHPVSGPYIDGYITWGASNETTRRFGKQQWQVVPMPLAVDAAPPPRPETENLRRGFPENVLLGTLARTEKIDSAPYLRAVADILAANPQAGFVWTGRSEHSGIAGFFRDAGVASRCHFAGWVDTKLYASALDVFLDTFPVGSGVTSLQAMGLGVPLLSYLGPNTIFGTYYWSQLPSPALGAPDEYPILCARDADEYVALAGKLIAEPEWRAAIGQRGEAFYREEMQKNAAYAERFFETVSRIAAGKR